MFKSIFTEFTSYWLLSSMSSLMYNEIGRYRKCFFTEHTFEWFLSYCEFVDVPLIDKKPQMHFHRIHILMVSLQYEFFDECTYNWEKTSNEFSQRIYWNGFSPVCITVYFVKIVCQQNTFSEIKHLNDFSSEFLSSTILNHQVDLISFDSIWILKVSLLYYFLLLFKTSY